MDDNSKEHTSKPKKDSIPCKYCGRTFSIYSPNVTSHFCWSRLDRLRSTMEKNVPACRYVKT